MHAILARCLHSNLLLLTFISVTVSFIIPHPVFASLTACSTAISPESMNLGSTGDISFQITNDDTEGAQMQWVRLAVPSSNFHIDGGDGNTIDYSDLSIESGSYITETISVTAGDTEITTEDWIVLASDDPGGAAAIGCTGNLGFSITDSSNSVAPVISDIVLSRVSSSSITISWTTDKNATSIVNYGTTSSYGSTSSDLTPKTTHSITLNSLSSNTSYHYQITSVDESSNSSSTSDNTFATPSTSSSSTTTITTVVTQSVTKTTTDQSLPTINLSTKIKNPYKVPPEIVGVARDNKSVSRVEYSVDDGKNWHLVGATAFGRTSVSFKFTPDILEDDNYMLVVRAIDSSGNIAKTRAQLLVIDKLPPLIGANIFTLGPQIVQESHGIIYGLSGLDQKISLSAIGGVVGIDLHSAKKMFTLAKNIESGLWSGIMSFEKPGNYSIEAKSIDGANNKSSKKLSSINVLPNGVVKGNKSVIKNAVITVFYKDIVSGYFVKWEADSYNQINPQLTDSEGKYKFFLPPGTFYIEVNAPSFKPLRTNIFSVNKSVPINSDFILEERDYFNFGPLRIPLLNFQSNTITINPMKIFNDFKANKESLIGTNFPEVKLNDEFKEISTDSFKGQNTLITIMNTWDPQINAQISSLKEIVEMGKMKVVGIFPQESEGKIMIFKNRGGYTFDMLADQEGELMELLRIKSIPTHFYIDKRGIIKKISYGLMSSHELDDFLID